MKESNEYNQMITIKHIRHCVVLLNALMSLAFIHYAGYLLYKVYTAIF
jgi:hypothetical protein